MTRRSAATRPRSTASEASTRPTPAASPSARTVTRRTTPTRPSRSTARPAGFRTRTPTGLPTGASIALGRAVVQDHVHRPSDPVHLRVVREQRGVRPLDRPDGRDADRVGLGWRRRPDLHVADQPSTTASGTRSSKPTTARAISLYLDGVRWSSRPRRATRSSTPPAFRSVTSTMPPTSTRASRSTDPLTSSPSTTSR